MTAIMTTAERFKESQSSLTITVYENAEHFSVRLENLDVLVVTQSLVD